MYPIIAQVQSPHINVTITCEYNEHAFDTSQFDNIVFSLTHYTSRLLQTRLRF